jgi:hypothetical protein
MLAQSCLPLIMCFKYLMVECKLILVWVCTIVSFILYKLSVFAFAFSNVFDFSRMKQRRILILLLLYIYTLQIITLSLAFRG